MYYPNYNPFYMRRTNNYYAHTNTEQKKDTVPPSDTIPFSSYTPNNNEEKPHTDKTSNNTLLSFKDNKINILGFEFETDDLIILVLILLLFRDFNENFILIIILGLILLNVNLSDIINLF